MAVRKYPEMTLDTTTLARLFGTLHNTIVQHGRDYVYQERLSHRMHDMHYIFARLHGYQDSYVPYTLAAEDGLTVGCSCPRPTPCAHVAALWWAYIHESDTFGLVPQSLWQNNPSIVPQWAGGTFPWDKIPANKPSWQQPWNEEKSLATWESAVASTKSTRRWSDSQMARMLPELDESWCNAPVWRKHWAEFVVTQWTQLTQQPFRYWWMLWLNAPYLPLDPIWPAYDAIPSDEWLYCAIHTLSRNRSHMAAFINVLTEIAPKGGIQWLHQTIELAPALDPWHLARARLLMHSKRPQEAIALLQTQWPSSKEGQRLVRHQLIEWLPPSQQLAYQVADCLDSSSDECLELLRPQLGEKGWEALRQAKANRRVSPSAEQGDLTALAQEFVPVWPPGAD